MLIATEKVVYQFLKRFMFNAQYLFLDPAMHEGFITGWAHITWIRSGPRLTRPNVRFRSTKDGVSLGDVGCILMRRDRREFSPSEKRTLTLRCERFLLLFNHLSENISSFEKGVRIFGNYELLKLLECVYGSYMLYRKLLAQLLMY